MATSSPSLDNASLSAQAAQQHALPSASLSNSNASSTPSLPPEIFHRIIQLALPRLSIETYRERYDTLITFGRVNSTWHALTQTELYRHVVLSSATRVKKLQEQLSSNPECAIVIRSASFFCPGSRSWKGGLEEVYAVLRLSTEVKEVWMYESVPRNLNLETLSRSAPNLEVLCIDHYQSTHLPTTGRPAFPHLRTLAVFVAESTDSLADILALPLPQLRHLLITNFQVSSTRLRDGIGTAIARIGPNLETFALTETDAGTLATLDWWTSIPLLKTLVVSEQFSNRSTPLALIPSEVKILRLPRVYRDGQQNLATDLHSYVSFVKSCLSSTTLDHLESLSLTPLDSFCFEDARRSGTERDEASIELEELCSGHKVDLTWGEAGGRGPFSAYWENLVTGGAELSRSR